MKDFSFPRAIVGADRQDREIAITERFAMAIALLLCALAPATAWSAGGAGLTLRRPRALHVEMMATTATGLVYVETVTGNGRTPAPDDLREMA